MNISTDGMIAAIRSAAERVEPRESEVLNGIADRIAELVASANKNRRTAKHYERGLVGIANNEIRKDIDLVVQVPLFEIFIAINNGRDKS